jgi:hypothetical protein
VDRAVNLLQEHANQQRTDKRKSWELMLGNIYKFHLKTIIFILNSLVLSDDIL